ncbi:hypothetical protein NLI96_g8578 [Meripilus lineatus]|uniref:Uncharacterized protein n=1 Tax=Meripilus lineatus TaxID=2056292 RepID=A0AAD5UX29_9APHY|nr:hypothetical protein NLI96_g8578 [Physisporinus lineatus]
MGLGKTLTMLSLIVATRNDVSKDFSKSTLIVVPLSVMSNWETQIQDHVGDGVLSYCLYYGSGRNMTAEELSRYDIVITTYQTVSGEHGDAPAKVEGDGPSKKRKRVERSLFMVKWKRIILDEGHNIRNPKTKMAQSVCGLEAERRWVLSGTPIINSPRDLGSILTFLRICSPLDNEDFFKRMLLRPLTAGDPSGAEMLRALMSHVCIRRTKEMQDSEGNSLVPLPPVEVTMVPVALDPKARELYDSVEELSQQRFGDLLRTHGGIHSLAVQSNVLSMLTRMRQLVLHPGLVPPNYLEHLRRADEHDDSATPAIQLTSEAKVRLQGILAQAIEDNEECPICFSIPDQPRITSCSHVFCLPCITEIISRDPKCPMDRRQITLGDLIEPPPPTELTQAPIHRNGDEEDDFDSLRTGSSAKIDQLIYLLKLTPLTEKSLVFSQFTSFLDKIAENLDREGISYVRFDGQMSARRRQETIARFSVPLKEDEPTVLPASESAPSSRRRTRSKRAIDIDGDVIVNDDKDDDDYVAQGDDGDDDFIEEEVPKPKKRKTKGKGKAKAGVSRSTPFDDITELGNTSSSEVNPKVMLISLKAGALGLNLTVANNVYLMDPIGQTKPVRVYQLIAEKTVESKVIEIQEKKKKLIEQAFSGIKSNETKRQKKEARLQELIELFGARQATQNNASTSTSQSTLEAWRA